jgi:hypothetical protein
MSSEAEEKQMLQVVSCLRDFVRILVKEYPLVFKNSSGAIKIPPSVHPVFPYEVSLKIKRA